MAAGADELVVDDLEVVVDALGGTAAEVAAGFLAAAVVAAVVLGLGLLGELGTPPTAVEVRREVPVAAEMGVRFFSSSETEGRERCETVEAAVDGRLAAVVPAAAGLVAGLLALAVVLVRVAELVVELAVDFVDAVPVAAGRRVAEVAGAVVRFTAAAPAAGFFAVAPFGEAGVAAAAGSDAGSGAGAGAGASVCWTTSKLSTSDMMGYEGEVVSKSERGENKPATMGLLALIRTVSSRAVECCQMGNKRGKA